jgi:hypothetical protein
MIYEIRIGDTLLYPIKSEHYSVIEINDGHLIVCLRNEKRAFRVLYYSAIIKDKWKISIWKIEQSIKIKLFVTMSGHIPKG